MVNRRVVVAAVALPILCSALAVTLTSSRGGAVIPTAPHIELPAAFDLGSRTTGETVVVRIPIVNTGGRPLVLNDMQSNCTCTAVACETEGGDRPFTTLTILPGDTAWLRATVAVRTAVSDFQSVVGFRTTDPGRPQVQVKFRATRVRHGMMPLPAAAAFGRVPVGTPVKRSIMIDMIDGNRPPRGILSVTSNRPDLFTVTLHPPTTESSDRLSGRIEVVLRTDAPAELRGYIEIAVADGPVPDAIPVSASVVPPIQAVPAVVRLPRATAEGSYYGMECLVRAESGSPVTLTVVEPVVGVTTSIAGDRPTLTATPPKHGTPVAQGTLVLRVTADGSDSLLKLPVTVSPPSEGTP